MQFSVHHLQRYDTLHGNEYFCSAYNENLFQRLNDGTPNYK